LNCIITPINTQKNRKPKQNTMLSKRWSLNFSSLWTIMVSTLVSLMRSRSTYVLDMVVCDGMKYVWRILSKSYIYSDLLYVLFPILCSNYFLILDKQVHTNRYKSILTYGMFGVCFKMFFVLFIKKYRV